MINNRNMKALHDDLLKRAAELGAKVIEDQADAGMSYSLLKHKGFPTPELHIGPVTSPLNYFIALHELGHVATTTQNTGDMHERRQHEIQWETDATAWARDHSLVPFEDVQGDMADSLFTYATSGDYLPRDRHNLETILGTRVDLFEQEAESYSRSISDPEYDFNTKLEAVMRGL